MTAVTTRPTRRPGWAACTAIWALTATALLTGAPQAGAQSPGEVVVVSGADGSPITGGGSDTAFSLRLPDGAACPGDSEQGEYRVQGFLVPASVDPGTLEYKGLRPQTDGGWPLYEVSSITYMNRATDKADEPGGEGTIINIPAFSFAVFEPGMVPLGRAHLGIACSHYGTTERYWATDIEVVSDDADPAGIAWTVVDPPAPADEGSSAPVTMGLAAVALAAAVGVGRRRRRSAARHRSSVHP
jgi:MYXO-CTERM domain-containing protein